MDRAVFLDRVRRRLAGPEPHNVAHPLVEVDGVPEPVHAADLSDVTSAFCTSVGALGARASRVDTDDALATLVHDLVAERAVTTAVRSEDPEAVAVEPVLREVGVELVPFRLGPALAAAELGVTGAAYGLAATGSLVLSAARAGGRTAGLLPPVHLALVRERNLLPDSASLFRRIPERFPDGLPSQLVLASGPSRTGDIELILTTGVHGPGTVVVAVLADGVLDS